MLYTISEYPTSISKPVISFFSLRKVRMYIESNPGKYMISDGKSKPKILTLEDIEAKEVDELERDLERGYRR